MHDKAAQSHAPLIAALMLAELTCSFEASMIFIALTPLYKIYGDPISVGWLVTAFTLTSAASAALGGRLADLFGRRRVLLIMLCLSLAGSLLSAVAHDLWLVVLGRAIQGAAMAILPICFGILRENLKADQLGFSVGLLGGTYSIGTGVGTALGGFMIDQFAWQSIFYASSATAAGTILLVWLVVPGRPGVAPSGKFDFLGGVLFVPSVALTLYALSEGGRQGWLGLPLILMIAGLVTAALWIWYELKIPEPLIDVRSLRDKRLALANIVVFLTAMGPMTAVAIMLPLLQQPVWTGIGFGITATLAGMIKLPINICGGIGIFAGGALSRTLGMERILVGAGSISVIGWLLLTVAPAPLWLVILIFAAFIIPGASMTYALVPQIIIQAAPAERTSEATGIALVNKAVGNTIGLELVAVCLASEMISSGEDKGAYPSPDAYLTAFTVILSISFLALIACLFLQKHKVQVAGKSELPV